MNNYGIEVLLPLKRTARRIEEMERVTFNQFKYRYNNQPIAKLFTEIDGFKGAMRLFVKQNDDGSLLALITNKKYFRAARAMEIYSRRWRIENFFNYNIFLGIDYLPSLEINAIQTALTLKMLSFNLLDNFRKNLPYPFSKMKPESIHKKFIQGGQGKVQVKKGKLQIDIYGLANRHIVEPMFKNLEQKLISQNIYPRCPWLNDHVLNFTFK